MVRDPALPEVAVSARPHRAVWGTAVTCIAAACALAGCERVTTPAPQTAASVPAPEPTASAPAAAAAPAAVPVAYTPPSADVLYQMVAPIALYPDKLVAQVLAGATYPDQVSAAETWLAQNPGLKGSALVNAVDPQPWDPSVKSLTAFPNVLEQMASNLPWTTALGKAYYHDPADVMNAIQAMRARAAHAGTLKSSPACAWRRWKPVPCRRRCRRRRRPWRCTRGRRWSHRHPPSSPSSLPRCRRSMCRAMTRPWCTARRWPCIPATAGPCRCSLHRWRSPRAGPRGRGRAGLRCRRPGRSAGHQPPPWLGMERLEPALGAAASAADRLGSRAAATCLGPCGRVPRSHLRVELTHGDREHS